ncbi:MAG: hypothetical protein WBM64_15415 [Woeseiaceae bacterium]
MKKTLFLVLAIACVAMSTAIAADLPKYYPENGFQKTGRVDAVYADENRIIIGDISYQMSTSVVVRSMSSYSDSLARVRPGAHVGFRLGKSGRLIEEFWLLPSNYRAPRQR